ncbi:MAG: (d)CMP kinase [Clostridia bacterium]|nr:(d)CMP kinase [Clostridia bacterium]MBQ7224650.1 (d)CMP kinase [Clostridia bacterium]
MIIAIDGPSGAGKSTVAKLLAAKMGIVYLDTGAMYRAMGLKALNSGVSPTDAVEVEKLLAVTEIDVKNIDGTQHVYLDGEDVSTLIREHRVSKAASDISAIPCVRFAMVELQRKLASKKDTVLDGRDIGTYVLPNADHKFFLTASADERANRRYKELIAKGEECTFEKIKQDIITRDYNDSHRALAPLKKADDAIEIDTTEMTVDDVINKMISVLGD